MTDTLFVQFYNKSKSGYYDLCNGFSDTYDLCAGTGDFYWTEHEPDRGKWYSEETYQGRELPINKGKVYISAIYANHLFQAYVWAKAYPDITFTVGGPVAAERCIEAKQWNPIYLIVDDGFSIPDNLIITGKSVEDIFGVPNFSGRWKLDIPQFVPETAKIYFSYTIDNGCYWKKCEFCNIALHAREAFRARKEMHLEFKDLDHPGHKIVRLNTGSIPLQFIRQTLPKLPRRGDMEYRMFIRTGRAENAALKEMLAGYEGRFPSSILGFGMEFPSNRMLKSMGKGCTTEDVLAFIRICRGRDIRINANFILGWNNLTEADLGELKGFLEAMPENAFTSLQARWLLAHPYSKIHDTYQGEPIRLGPFYEGFRVNINDEQMLLNQKAADIVEKYSVIKNYKLEGMPNIRKQLSGA
ncbi:MAG: hypothetical protein ABIL58_25375 [Pseudomonadota bacterium]